MKVSEALATRISCRAFLPDPVPEAVVRRILDHAKQAPSGGNLQPWIVRVLAGDALAALKAEVAAAMETHPMGRPTEYAIYPEPLIQPFHDRRKTCGEQLYATIGVPREDKAGRLRQFRRNFEFFGAPVGLFLFLDRTMGPPQWSDAGMFLQSVMLAAREEGLHTCAQEAWAMWAEEVERHARPPEGAMLFCGMGLGHMDEAHPINALRTEREPVEGFAELIGF